jgi:serine/threonine protein kinase
LIRIFLDEGSSGMTTTTHHTGTERYLAYELVMAGEDARPTTFSDIYAVGCIGLEVSHFSSYRSKNVILMISLVYLLQDPLRQAEE